MHSRITPTQDINDENLGDRNLLCSFSFGNFIKAQQHWVPLTLQVDDKGTSLTYLDSGISPN